ncbi:hypothetical protein GQ44DRAFT_715929 [Phaeosphaeriaceae sp. PMI808]|nr:hypothetical protein GQ44DRAFT_715929 [Phaeosphaeriaceae sp. PMI808]
MQCASSDSQVSRHSPTHDLGIMSIESLQKPITQPQSISRHLCDFREVQPLRTAVNYTDDFEEELPSELRCCAHIRSISNPDLSKSFTQSKSRIQATTLKTCLKKNKPSPTTRSSAAPYNTEGSYLGNKTLRRVKTVDFMEATSPMLALPSNVVSKKVVHSGTHSSRSIARVTRPRNSVHRTISCPGIIRNTKGKLASPAITRTDVHVVALTPPRNLDRDANEMMMDPITPTIQIAESNNCLYETIWDDVPSEHSNFLQHLSSPAAYSLQAVSFTGVQGLQRVNSKLTDWSGAWDRPSGALTPTVIVFPDEDDCSPHSQYSGEDDMNLVVAPPNSQRTSGAPSRTPSRPGSTLDMNLPSQETICLDKSPQGSSFTGKQNWLLPSEGALAVPESEIQPSKRVTSSTRRAKPFPAYRKLSNIDPSDLKFRGHRDSLTLAHSRLVRSGGISPELFTHSSSISIAKKRMHARDQATSMVKSPPPTGFNRDASVVADISSE